jgi:hypothetical protein
VRGVPVPAEEEGSAGSGPVVRDRAERLDEMGGRQAWEGVGSAVSEKVEPSGQDKKTPQHQAQPSRSEPQDNPRVFWEAGTQPGGHPKLACL